MATTVLMPKLGQSVESCIIVAWHKAVGESIAVDETLCEVETDKATMEVPSLVAGTVIAHYFAVGDEVPVQAALALIGTPAEAAVANPDPVAAGIPMSTPASNDLSPVSPRARRLAERKGLDLTTVTGSGPGGRRIERDIQGALTTQLRLTPVAKAMVAEGDYQPPAQGSGRGGWITSKDLQSRSPQVEPQIDPAVAPPVTPPASATPSTPTTAPVPQGDGVQIPVRGVRKVIAERMLHSLQSTAQLTMNMAADARALRAYRERLKQSPEAWGLCQISINDLLLFVLARTLTHFPDLNAHYQGEMITQYGEVHLGFAVDIARGLLVPVIRHADRLTLRQIAAESKRLAAACQGGKITPDELQGGTFTLTNLGAFGIESFTPVLNPPQVGILGVGAIGLKAVETAQGIEQLPHIALSLTINHQVVDGAPAARFLQRLAQGIAQIDLLLAG